jgi:cyanophycin synthetase
VELVEIRDLDGPNLFRMEPAIKIELRLARDEDRESLVRELSAAVADLHQRLGLHPPRITSHTVDNPEHLVVAFDWEWRSCAAGIAKAAVETVLDPTFQVPVERLEARFADDRRDGDHPLWVRDAERPTEAVGVTGTNGKTTTTRLIAHIAQLAGRRVGWSSSTGVYIEGARVLQGDYSGPSGARRVFEESDLDLAVLETARGGLLLRGLAYESNDVGVFLNVSADHLSLQGVETVETLAKVKCIVVKATRAAGLVVLNADDELVLACGEHVSAPILLFGQHPEQACIVRQIEAGRSAVVRERDEIVYYAGGSRHPVAALADVPMTFAGAAPFMVENALAATGAAIGLGFDIATIAAGLRTFRNDSASNRGRLNVFDVNGKVVVLDYAHNDIGLEGLCGFCRAIMHGRGKLHVVVGTAGDRRDDDFAALGRISRQRADVAYFKDTQTYLRGREPGEMTIIMRSGFDDAAGDARFAGAFEDEFSAFAAALASAGEGDHIAVMCQVDQDRIIDEIGRLGGREWA